MRSNILAIGTALFAWPSLRLLIYDYILWNSDVTSNPSGSKLDYIWLDFIVINYCSSFYGKASRILII